MPIIRITSSTKATLRSLAPPWTTWKDTTRPTGDGEWYINVDEKIHTILTSLLLPGESFDDVIMRLAQHQQQNESRN